MSRAGTQWFQLSLAVMLLSFPYTLLLCLCFISLLQLPVSSQPLTYTGYTQVNPT
jgi:uncharacterized membrane protein